MSKWLWLALIPSLVFAQSPAPQQTQPQSAILLTTNEIPIEIEVQAESITFLSDHTVVTRNQLQVEGNAFDFMLVRFLTERVCPNIQWHTQPGGEDLENQLRRKIDAVRLILGCPNRFSGLFEALEKIDQMDLNRDSRPVPPRFMNLRQNPVFVDVEADQLTIYPEKNIIQKADVQLPDGEFAAFLDRIEAVRDTQCITLLLRPGSAVFQRQLRQLIRDRGIDVSFDPWDAERIIVIPEPTSTDAVSFETQERGIPKPPNSVAVSAETQPIAVRPAGEKWIEVEVMADSLTILPGHIGVASNELQTPGNAFELLLDQFEANGDCPHICLLGDPRGEALRAHLGALIQERGERMGCSMGTISNQISVLVSTPRDMPMDDKSPVFFECRNSQLFSISLERLKQACDEKTTELREAAGGDEAKFLKIAGQTALELDGYRLDYTYALMGKYLLMPIPDAKGHSVEYTLPELDESWFGSQLAELDPKKQFLCLFVRSDSFKLFQQARAAAWIKNFTVTCELLDDNVPIMLGPGGNRIFAQ